jgi:citrate synthase
MKNAGAWLTATQASARLGIKPETLYAYVSRGLVTRERGAHGSRFDPLEVERFARSRRTVADRPQSTPDGRPLAVIDTDIASIEDGELYFRGMSARELARDHSYEWTLSRLITGTGSDTAFLSRPSAIAAAADVMAAVPRTATLRDKLQVIVTVLGCTDPLRFDLDRDTVSRTAGPMIAGMVDALPAKQPVAPPDAPIAARLWRKLTEQPETERALRSLNGALVLLIDHDVAISTLAARAAASARANVYAVVSSGLGALDSALHGSMSRSVHGMLSQVCERGDPESVVGEWIQRTGRGVPGFGQILYPGTDPRAETLLALLEEADASEVVIRAARETAAIVAERTGAHPNVDFALATLTLAYAMPADAGEAIFAIARSGGWLVHAMAEYRMDPLRLRPVGRYVGP